MNRKGFGKPMLVLSRRRDEAIVIGNGDITVTVVDIRGDKVRLGVTAPREVPVHRWEVFDAIRRGIQRKNKAGRTALFGLIKRLGAGPSVIPTAGTATEEELPDARDRAGRGNPLPDSAPQ